MPVRRPICKRFIEFKSRLPGVGFRPERGQRNEIDQQPQAAARLSICIFDIFDINTDRHADLARRPSWKTALIPRQRTARRPHAGADRKHQGGGLHPESVKSMADKVDTAQKSNFSTRIDPIRSTCQNADAGEKPDEARRPASIAVH
jgi:hypothetical protein